MISGKLDLHAIALTPIHHGGEGTQGNKETIRTQTFMHPMKAERMEVPVISGNSVKHMIRHHGALFALEAAGLNSGEWTKAQRDLLLSGGTFSSGGSSVKLDAARRMEEAFPILSVCGYAAGNYGAESKLDVDWWHVVCEENRWRMPGSLEERLEDDARMLLSASAKSAWAYSGKEFGTRHEPGSPEATKMLTGDEKKRIEGARSNRQGDKHPDKGDSMQMIYEFQTLVAGTQFFSTIHFRNLDRLEKAALTGALHHACHETRDDGRQVYQVGGKGSVGIGKVAVRWFGSLREDIRPPEHVDEDALVAFAEDGSEMERYVEHLREHSDDLRKAMEAML